MSGVCLCICTIVLRIKVYSFESLIIMMFGSVCVWPLWCVFDHYDVRLTIIMCVWPLWCRGRMWSAGSNANLTGSVFVEGMNQNDRRPRGGRTALNTSSKGDDLFWFWSVCSAPRSGAGRICVHVCVCMYVCDVCVYVFWSWSVCSAARRSAGSICVHACMCVCVCMCMWCVCVMCVCYACMVRTYVDDETALIRM